MKPAKNILSQITAPADAAIAEREDETTETTPLHPKQLQQFLQQLNWQEQDLAAAGISATLLTEDFNRSWYGRLNRWFLREPLLFKILQWPFSKRWPAGSVLPTDNERLLKRIYGVNGYLEGTDLMLNKVWSSLLLSFLTVDIYNYYRYPSLRYGNTLLKVFLAQTDNQQMLSNVLTLPQAWPLLLGTPILWGALKALLSARHAKAVDKDAYRTLLETLGHYQASLWKDIGRWVLPSLLPEFAPNLALFALLPEPKLKLALESAERLLLWDRRISPDERRILLQQVQVLARKATHITQLKALATLAKVADSIALNDLIRLSQQGTDAETLKSLLWVKQQARQTLQQVAQNPLTQSLLPLIEMEPSLNFPLMDEKLTTPSRSRYLYTHYLLWTLGQPHDYRLQPLFWGYLAFQGYFKARFFYLLGRGMYDTLKHYWDKWLCESEDKLWSYFNERAAWECSVCGDLPLFYNDVFEEKTCWEAYVKSPRPVDKLVELINRLSFATISTIDLSEQRLRMEDLITVLSALQPKAPRIQTLLLNGTSFLNTAAIHTITDFLHRSLITTLDLSRTGIQDEDIQWLAQALPSSQVKSLDLGFNLIGEEAANSLAKYLLDSQIQVLNLMGNIIGSKGAQSLGQILNRSRIQSLNLRYNTIDTEGAKELALGLPGSQVQVLLLTDNRIGPKGTLYLAQKLSGSQVQILDLSANFIGDKGAQELGQVLNHSQVHTLDLSDNFIKGGTKALAQGLLNSQVQFLHLGSNHIDDDDVKELALVLPDSQVKYLNLRGNSINSEGAKSLAQGLLNSQVQTLDLNVNNIGDKGLKELAQGINGSQLENLNLQSNKISNEGAKSLGQVLPNSQIKALYLSENLIGDEGAKSLAQGLPGSLVQTLDLSGNNISNVGVENFAQGLSRSRVELLVLSGDFGSEGVKSLGQVLNNSRLQFLGLSGKNIGDEGAESIGQALNSSQLQILILHGNIGDKGVRSLVQGLPGSRLQVLALGSNIIGDDGCLALADLLVKSSLNPHDLANLLTPDAKKALARAEPNTQLTGISLDNNNISTQGARALCQVLPQTYVRYFSLSGNPLIDPAQVDTSTCYISGVNILQPSGPYVMLYRLYQVTLRYLMNGYSYCTARQTASTPSSSADNDQDQLLSLPNSMALTQEPPDAMAILPDEIIINEPPAINDAPREIQRNEPLSTFKVIPTTLAEPTMATVSSGLLITSAHISKHPFSFFHGLANSPSVTQPFHSNLPALPKPAETLPTMTALGAVGAAVTSLLALGYWAWKNIRRNNSTAIVVSEKVDHFEPDVKTLKSVF
jgi:Ran GTPase-activating protein (RanGAP) involved in mRNA processing and transport